MKDQILKIKENAKNEIEKAESLQNLNDVRVYIIPILYIVVIFINTKITTNLTSKNNNKNKNENNKELNCKSNKL